MTWRPWNFTTMLAAALLIAAGPLRAQSCTELSYQLQDSYTSFRDMRKGTTLDEAKAIAKQIRVDLNNAAASAMSCRCGRAATELQSAAAFARRAEDAATSELFMQHYNRAVLGYNLALDALRDCP